MSSQNLTLLLLGAAAGRQDMLAAAGFAIALTAPGAGPALHDAVLMQAATRDEMAALAEQGELSAAAVDHAVVVLAAVADDALEAALLRAGTEAIVAEAEGVEALRRAIRHAVERKRLERAARTAYATDLGTGLPHEAQLIEHMSQLLALRDREPVPMGLIVLRLEGLDAAAARLGEVAARLLRRKLAVRLRSGLRASDVVAALGRDAFAVLLGRMENRGDGERVVHKLTRSLHQPLVVAGETCSLRAAVGLAIYPEHGKNARSLLQRAAAQAGWVATAGVRQYAGRSEGGAGTAANDEAR
ncbi:GGDEF domain-containing protein [Rubrivivax sp. A210]|uniref:GGDEF domain-containing protein n=1 Tax=Rubrivivax sp. A210 TaxID=2772301 RepID=UPI001919BC66|nr:GGDEF domain-containing protein [Rubrivivax sp. A210]CAD5372221.1 GGDEF domain-containing protein [Rubrivivax sp. A210]